MRTLILGGARSGKSRHAEHLGLASGLRLVYIATAQADDAEMAARIARHRAQRDPAWLTVEEPCGLAAALIIHTDPDCFVLVDCLTLWLSNVLQEGEERFRCERGALLDLLPNYPGQICLVSNEVGQGIVPANALARRFIDEAGWLHQDLARVCERVVWVAAGLPQILK